MAGEKLSQVFIANPTTTIAATDLMYIDKGGTTDAAMSGQSFANSIQSGKYYSGVDTGVADAYVVSLDPPVLSYYNGMIISFTPVNSNLTTSVTLKLNSLATKQVLVNAGNPLPSDLLAGTTALLIYDSTASSFILINPQASVVYPADLVNNYYSYGVDDGAANAYNIPLPLTAADYISPAANIFFMASHNNTAASTVTLNSISSHNIVTPNNNALVGGEIISGHIYCIQFNNTFGAGSWVLLNSSLPPSAPLWNATTNIPALVTSTAALSIMYLVDVAGTTSLDGIATWEVGDYAYFTGGVWTRLLMIEAARVQSLSNKKLITGSVTFNDTSDPTKAMNVSLSVMTTGKTGTLKWISTDDQTVTIPDGSGGEDFTVVGAGMVQTIINKSIGNSDIDATTITTACDFVDNADDTKTWALNLNGKTTGTAVSSVYTGGAQTVTYPTGDFTVAKLGDNAIGNVTPYVVGTSLTTAPYTSIDTAITAANAVFVSSGFKQLVYIQPGEYTQNFTPKAGVDICGLGYGVVLDNTAQIPTCAVKIKGQMILTNAVNINIVGVQIDAPSAITITCTGSNVPVVNFSYCILKKSTGTGTSMFFNSNTNLVAGFSNCLLVGVTSKKVFDVSGGIYRLKDCTQISGSNAPASFTNAQVYYDDCTVNDSLDFPSGTHGFIYDSTIVTGGNFACVILGAANSQLETYNSVFSASGGFTNFVIEGAAGAGAIINNAIYIDLAQIDPDLYLTAYTQSPNAGNTYVLQASGDFTLTPQQSILAINKTVAGVTTVTLPAVGFAVGQTYEITDQKRDASSNNITLAPASGDIQGASTFVMNIDGQSVTVRDFGNEYTII